MPMFTREILFGMNLISLGGFLVMAFAYYLTRSKQARAPIAFALMGIGTVLVFAGLYLAPPAGPPGH
jgi:hypothetical protein